MKALPQAAPREEVDEPPKLEVTHRNDPLSHKTSFEQGDVLKARNKAVGLEEGVEYPILGYWPSEHGMHVYLPASPIGYLKNYRTAVENGRDHEEVLFYQLPDIITELRLQDYIDLRIKGKPVVLEYLPARAPETIMRRVYGGLWEEPKPTPEPEERDNVIPLVNDKGQYVFPFYQIA